MSLINCPECKREISDRAVACPHCGCPEAGGAAAVDRLHESTVTPDRWPSIEGHEWAGTRSEALWCQTCGERVFFPRDQATHGSHQVGPLSGISGPAPPVESTGTANAPTHAEPIADDTGSKRWDWGRIANFQSRTARSEFWTAHGVALAVAIAVPLTGLDSLSGLMAWITFAIWSWLSVGSSVNRLHDMNYSGWLILLYLVPVVNFFVWIWLGSGKGKSESNQWGPPIAQPRSG
ncbi:MAG: DUF805 domain-containing protein [Actinomycetota bacterium]